MRRPRLEPVELCACHRGRNPATTWKLSRRKRESPARTTRPGTLRNRVIGISFKKNCRSFLSLYKFCFMDFFAYTFCKILHFLISACHCQAEHSRWQHVSRRSVWMGSVRREKFTGRVRQEVVFGPEPGWRICHGYRLFNSWTGTFQIERPCDVL